MKTERELVVVAPTYGAPSETFIHRHMSDLLPGRTSVVVRERQGEGTPVSEDALTVLSDNRVRECQCTRRRLLDRLKIGNRDSVERRVLSRMRDHYGAKVVLCEYMDYGLEWVEAARACGLSFFVHAHGYDVSMKLREHGMAERYREAYAEIDGAIVVSHAQRERLVEIGLPPERIIMIPYGIDSPDEQPVHPDQAPVRCVAVGRMVGKKAPILLLEAFRRAWTRGSCIELDYYGGGPLLAAAEQFVHAFGLRDVVRLHGVTSHPEILEAMRGADIFLQHSWTDPGTGDQEGLPVAILEAMAHGLPVISTRHAGIPDAVVNGETGFIVEEGAVDAMSDRLYEMVCDHTCRNRLGNAGAMRQRDLFSWPKEQRQLREVLGIEQRMM